MRELSVFSYVGFDALLHLRVLQTLEGIVGTILSNRDAGCLLGSLFCGISHHHPRRPAEAEAGSIFWPRRLVPRPSLLYPIASFPPASRHGLPDLCPHMFLVPTHPGCVSPCFYHSFTLLGDRYPFLPSLCPSQIRLT